jgi:hypothetical protein
LTTVAPAALAGEQFYDGPANAEALKLDYADGISRHRLDGYTKVTGYRLSDTWYFGRQRGDDGGLALVWQGNRDQVSITTQGVRLTRRF